MVVAERGDDHAFRILHANLTHPCYDAGVLVGASPVQLTPIGKLISKHTKGAAWGGFFVAASVVLEIVGYGPSSTTYVNPEDDPTKK